MDNYDCEKFAKKDLFFLAKVDDPRFGKTSAMDEPHFNLIVGVKQMGGLFRNLFTNTLHANTKTDRSYLELTKTFPNIDPNNFYIIDGELWAVVEPKYLDGSRNSGVMIFEKSKLALDSTKGMEPNIHLVTDGDSTHGGKYILHPDDVGFAYVGINQFLDMPANQKISRDELCLAIHHAGIDYESGVLHSRNAVPTGILGALNYAIFEHNLDKLQDKNDETCKEN